MLDSLLYRQPLPTGPYPTAKFPAHLPEPARFTGPAHYETTGDAAYSLALIERMKPTADDLSNEFDEDVCAVLIKLIDAGRIEDAGRAVAVVRDALHRRYIAAAWGDKPSPSDWAVDSLTAAGLA
ncbi:MAG: hypothetical protein ACRC1H_09110 [Caldilineaceae bacterium]